MTILSQARDFRLRTDFSVDRNTTEKARPQPEFAGCGRSFLSAENKRPQQSLITVSGLHGGTHARVVCHGRRMARDQGCLTGARASAPVPPISIPSQINHRRGQAGSGYGGLITSRALPIISIWPRHQRRCHAGDAHASAAPKYLSAAGSHASATRARLQRVWKVKKPALVSRPMCLQCA